MSERRGLAAEQRLVRLLHAACELLSVALHVLVDRLLDELGLLQSGHQRRVADLLLGRLVYLDRGLGACHSVPRY
jgi:hypothetical protein